MTRAQTLAAVIVVFGGIGLAAAALHARESSYTLSPVTDRVLYLRSPRAADRLALSFDSVAADVYWIRTIQHYGRDFKNRTRASRFELLYPLLDLTTTLDPHFLIAYRFGALFLSARPPEGPGRPDQAIALLEKGLAVTPDQWLLAHDIGFVNYLYARDFKQAAEWFGKASAMPGAPVWLKQLAATTLARGGDRAGARQMLLMLRSSEEPYIQRSAERALMQIDALDAVDKLTELVDAFKARTGRLPSSWQELIAARMLEGIPADRLGAPFAYDPLTGKVSISPESPLLPILPTLLGK